MIELISGVKSDKGRREPSILRENYICRFGMDHGAQLQNVQMESWKDHFCGQR